MSPTPRRDTPKDMISREVYKKHLSRAGSLGNYFMFRRDYVAAGLLTRNDALFIQDLINHAYINEQTNGPQIDGHFLCTIKYLQNSLGWDPDTQADVLKRLSQKGFVSVKKLGMPAKRYVQVHIDKIEEKLDELLNQSSAISPNMSPVNTDDKPSAISPSMLGEIVGTNNKDTSYPMNIREINKTPGRRVRPAASPSAPGSLSSNNRFGTNNNTSSPGRVIADRLLQILTKHRVLPKTAKPNLWHDVITKKMLPLWSKDYILKVLDWYDENFGNDFMPECYCGKSLAEKFEKLERKMLREVGPPKEEIKYTAEENDEFFGGKYWKPKLVHEEEKPISPYTEWEDDGNGDYSDYL